MNNMTDSELLKRLEKVELTTSRELDRTVRKMADEAAGDFREPGETVPTGSFRWAWKLAAAVVLACGIAFAAWWANSNNPSGATEHNTHVKPVGPVDPFMADKSARAMAFREAWQKAVVEDGRLEPLPKGVTGEEQRRRIVAAFEHAIACMPEAPPCPSLLIRIGQLWNSSAIAPEHPGNALKAYERVEKEYPAAHKYVVQAIGGESYSYWLLGEPAKAAAKAQQLLDYTLPENAEAELVSFVRGMKEEIKPHLVSYKAAEQRELVVQAAQRFSPEYYAVVCKRLREFEGSSPPAVRASITRMYYKNGVERSEVYEFDSPDGTPYTESINYHKKLWGMLPAEDMAALEEWVKNRAPSKIVFRDGKTITTFKIAQDGKLNKKQTPHRPSYEDPGLNFWRLPILLKNVRTPEPTQGPWGKRTGLESYHRVNYEKWYFNPDRDYICESYEDGADHSRKHPRIVVSDPEARHFTRKEVLEYGKTPRGLWYPSRIETTRFRCDSKMVDGEIYETVIHIDDNRDIPNELFDPNSVTEEMFAK